ncbi:hypothetical protein ABC195_16005 [Microbacterium sp. 2P01SA-2]|uniref:hypothetical protein n=1 Tax=unclassified Microbacterium TaxID=2609290 RepID=UPI0039A0911F
MLNQALLDRMTIYDDQAALEPGHLTLDLVASGLRERLQSGISLACSIHASMTRRTSSVTLRSRRCAMMSSWARVDPFKLTASGFTGP